MSAHTSFRIGGPAAVMIFPKTAEELSSCLRLLKEHSIPPLILGGGTNVLAPQDGLNRVVICLRDALTGIRQKGERAIEAESGVPLARAAVFARDLGLAGMEFAHGIPGTVGGGVYMNAGAYGGEMRQVVTKVAAVDLGGDLHTVAGDALGFDYRTSVFEKSDLIVVSAEFALTKGDREAIRARMQALMEKRRASQPLELPSAGSTFKRPTGGYAAALIDDAGLKGFQIGGAAVSEKHAGFVVNKGGATSDDVLRLMEHIQKTVLEHSGILLEPEVRIWRRT